MMARLISSLLIIPITVFTIAEFDFNYKKHEKVFCVFSVICILVLSYYLGKVLPW